MSEVPLHPPPLREPRHPSRSRSPPCALSARSRAVTVRTPPPSTRRCCTPCATSGCSAGPPGSTGWCSESSSSRSAASSTGFVLLGDSWFQLLMAGALGIILTQFAFLAHEASHRRCSSPARPTTRPAASSPTLFVGISYSWWMTKHIRHHANPNVVGKDPDIDNDFIVFQPRRRRQGQPACTPSSPASRAGCSSRCSPSRASTCTCTASRTVFGKGKVDKRWPRDRA